MLFRAYGGGRWWRLLDSAGSNIELPEIGEEVLSPEGEPIEDWKPQAASSLRDLTSLEPSPIEEDTWDDDGDDVGLPPSVDTAEFKREELFAHAERSSSTSPMTVIGVVAALVLGAFVVGQQFWGVVRICVDTPWSRYPIWRYRIDSLKSDNSACESGEGTGRWNSASSDEYSSDRPGR